MDIETLEKFFFWCMLVNTGIYAITAIAVLVLREFVFMVHNKLFGFDRETVTRSTQKYLANFKLLITFFNFAPWIAILMIK